MIAAFFSCFVFLSSHEFEFFELVVKWGGECYIYQRNYFFNCLNLFKVESGCNLELYYIIVI